MYRVIHMGSHAFRRLSSFAFATFSFTVDAFQTQTPMAVPPSNHRRCFHSRTIGGDIRTSMINGDDERLTSRSVTERIQYAVRQSMRTTVNTRGASPAQLLEEALTKVWRTRQVGLPLRRCRVGPSTLSQAGLGLFATRPMDTGELVTLYPGDALRIWPPLREGSKQSQILTQVGTHIPRDEVERIFAARRAGTRESSLFLTQGMEVISEYELGMPDIEGWSGHKYTIVGDRYRINDAAYLGHMVNDAACAAVTEDDTPASSQAKEDVYLMQAKAGANAKWNIQTTHVEIVAIKPILAGQEIFVSYGKMYWLPRNPLGVIVKRNDATLGVFVPQASNITRVDLFGGSVTKNVDEGYALCDEILSPQHKDSAVTTKDVGDDERITSIVLSDEIQEGIDKMTEFNMEEGLARGYTPDEVRESMYATCWKMRLPDLRLRRCRVGPSTIPNAGLGVFATRNLAVGELITLYPGDALRIVSAVKPGQEGQNRYINTEFGTHISPDEVERFYEVKRTKTNDDSVFCGRGHASVVEYEIKTHDPNGETGRRYSIVGDRRRIDDPAYLGHMVNDFASAAVTVEDTPEIGYAKEQVYLKQSLSGANAKMEIQKTHVGIVTTKAIEAGQEIFMTYGELYWLPRFPDGTMFPRGSVDYSGKKVL